MSKMGLHVFGVELLGKIKKRRLRLSWSLPLERALKRKINNFAKFTSKNCTLYDLSDVLSETEAVKEELSSSLLGYYDSSSGVTNIVQNFLSTSRKSGRCGREVH